MLFKKKNKVLEEVDEFNGCKEKLKGAINSVINGEVYYFDEKEIGCEDLAFLWNNMLDVLCEEKKVIVRNVNGLLKYITEMEFVKDMINDVRVQSSTYHNIAASSQEMAASIDDVANFIENAADTTNDTEKVAIEGGENINRAFSFVNESFEDIDDINKQIKYVMDRTEKINGIVDIVKGIAEQTNLLALNAAIEAARAGEQGKGFTVVADEVRKLAEHTKESVKDIQENINELKVDMKKSLEKASETSAKLNTGKNLVDDALSSINTIVGRVKEVNDNVVQISANVEEQTAVTEEITREINSLNELTESLLNECDRTGSTIFDISKKVNSLRLSMITKELCLQDQDLLDVCITDHLIWKWRVYNMILGYDEIDINSIGTHHQCRLGKWYYGDASLDFKKEREFIELEEAHIRLHELAKEATIEYGKNDIEKAEGALMEMDRCSKIVVGALNNLKRNI
ncbi:methyl-accepting chemotaxis protein [Wukongibacter baidiensis]|uniref:methyl-accepting chemotaxis protein n=1 Tax=Wukongibacter baidiensis TaxID=1723361 RepID=UPI003D7FD83D